MPAGREAAWRGVVRRRAFGPAGRGGRLGMGTAGGVPPRRPATARKTSRRRPWSRPWPAFPRLPPREPPAGSVVAVAAGYDMKVVTGPVTMGESPFWCEETQTIIFVDIIGKKVLQFNPAFPDELKTISFEQYDGRVSPAVPVRGTSGSKLLVGSGRTVRLVDVDWGRWNANEPAKVIKDVPMVEVEKDMPGNRFNDGKADRAGRLWIGTMDDRQTSRRRRRRDVTNPNKGELFRFDLVNGDSNGARVAPTLAVGEGLKIPNGMAWTADNKVFYLADSAAGAIYRYDYLAEEGKVTNRTTAFVFDDHDVPGVPDGMTLDVDGNLWVACVHGGVVIRVDPRTGALLQTIPMGTTNPSAAEWGGRDRDVLYVSTARYKMDDAQLEKEPHAGCLFAITGLGTKGLHDAPFPAKTQSQQANSSWRHCISWITPALAFFLSSRGIASLL